MPQRALVEHRTTVRQRLEERCWRDRREPGDGERQSVEEALVPAIAGEDDAKARAMEDARDRDAAAEMGERHRLGHHQHARRLRHRAARVRRGEGIGAGGAAQRGTAGASFATSGDGSVTLASYGCVVLPNTFITRRT